MLKSHHLVSVDGTFSGNRVFADDRDDLSRVTLTQYNRVLVKKKKKALW